MAVRFFQNLLHLAYPLADRILPDERVDRLSGGLVTLPLRLLPLAAQVLVYAGLVLLGEYLIGDLLFQFIVLLKLPKVFRIEWLEPGFFARLGLYFQQGGFYLLGAYAALRVLGTAGAGVYLSAREIMILQRWPFAASIVRIPLATIRFVSFRQFPGERLLATGRLELAWSDRETLVLPAVPSGEKKLRLIMERLHQAAPSGRPAHRDQGPDRTETNNHTRQLENIQNQNGGRRRRRRRRRHGGGSEFRERGEDPMPV